MIVKALGDSAVVAVLGDRLDEKCLHKVRSLAAALRESRIPGFVDIVPAYTQVTVHYNPIQFCRAGEALPEVFRLVEECEARIRSSKAPAESGHEPAVVEIPVCYGGEYGSDLGYVASRCSLEDRAVINRHSSVTYAVQAIGFMPGFPYLTGLPPELATPRRSAPRSRVPAGSVAIGGSQTGVYPLATPAGWHIIGRTPQALFDPAKDPPCFLRAGDRVRFRPISIQEYVSWK